MQAVQAVLSHADPTWVLHQEYDRTFGSSDSSSSGNGSNAAAPQAQPAEPGSQPAEGVEPSPTGDAADPTSPQNYFQAVQQHLEANHPLEDLPPLPNERALDVLLRAAANVLKLPIHLARLDSPVPELLVYAETPGKGPHTGCLDCSFLE
jgi:hypothetical protein